MKTRRMTMAQALIAFLKQQHVERDGRDHAFFAGVVGIFGHGNVAGIGQALQENPDFPYILARNEQAGVHIATGFAKASNRLRTFACTSSIGPGATNMITGAALATINRLPVLLLPGDIFARRNVAPVLQQLESPATQDTSVNDCFKPVSRYWDRIYRPEQLITSLPEAMRVLTSPSDCGAVTLALPQDVQTEAYDYPEELFRKRVWLIRRGEPDRESLERAVKAIKRAERPLIVCGGGVPMSEASQALGEFAAQTRIPVAETQAGKGALAWNHAQVVGAIGATGSVAANRLANAADVVIGIGTRYSDFTTASMTAFQNPNVKFVNINTAEFDAYKVGAIPVVADARVALEQLSAALDGGSGAYKVSAAYAAEIAELKTKWDAEVDRLFHLKGQGSGGASAGGNARTTAGETPALQGASLLGPGGASAGGNARTTAGETPALQGASLLGPSGASAGGNARTTAGETPALQGASLLGPGGASAGGNARTTAGETPALHGASLLGPSGASAGGNARTTAGETPALHGASLLGPSGASGSGASAGAERKPAQSEVIAAMWEAADERDVVVSAAGSHPGDLHKLWRTRSPNGYHMEYGYSCMGYEIPGAMGAKMADPSREVFVFLGDGTYLMAPSEIATSIQEGVKIIIVLVDNGGFASIGSLSRSLGQGGFGTSYRARDAKSGQLDGEPLKVDFAANARSLGAHAVKAATLDELRTALAEAKAADRTTVIVVETDVSLSVPGYDSWWDVAVAEVSEMESVREARVRYEEARMRERHFL